ncbi:MAG: histidinol-phosphatase HisJ family protein [Candidatus Dormibacteria bacterium]
MSAGHSPPTSAAADGADLHVHTEWSWDAIDGSMEESCRRATVAGLGAVAFTEHADYSAIAGGAKLDAVGYLECLERCRRKFPALKIWSGVELGEPHRFPEEASALLAPGGFDLVLGSVHCIEAAGALVDLSQLGGPQLAAPETAMRAYFQELLDLLHGAVEFHVLAHLEYPKRYWPAGWPPYSSRQYRSELQAVLEAAVERGVVLELNTSSGIDPIRGLCPSAEVVGWWKQAGGRAVALGSDAHRPDRLGAGFRVAREVLEGAGFVASGARWGLWLDPETLTMAR